MYGSVVMEVEAEAGEHHDPYEVILDKAKAKAKVKTTPDLRKKIFAKWLPLSKHLLKNVLVRISRKTHASSSKGLLTLSLTHGRTIARSSTVRSMESPRHGELLLTFRLWSSVTLGKTSGTGVAFTRDPATGENVFYGEYLIDAQGEDVVAGVRTPKPIAKMAKDLPKSHKELLVIRKKLEKHFPRCAGC